MKDRYCSRRKRSEDMPLYQAGKYQFGLFRSRTRPNSKVYDGIEEGTAVIVVAAVAAHHRQAAGDVEVIAVGVGVPAVDALGRWNVVGPHLVDAVGRVFPGGVHERQLPAAPVLPAGDLLGIVGLQLVILERGLAESALVSAILGGDVVRRHFAGGGVLVPGQARLVVEVDADAIGAGAVHEGPASNPGGTAEEDVGIGPVALHANVHLVSAAHRAVPHVVEAALDRAVGADAAVGRVEQVEAEAVFAHERLVRPGGPAAPVADAEAALANVAVDFDVALGRGAVGRDLQGVVSRPQQPAVEVIVLGGSCVLALDRGRLDREAEVELAAVRAGEGHGQLACGQCLRRAAHHRDIDPFVGLIRLTAQRQHQLERPGRSRDWPGRCEGLGQGQATGGAPREIAFFMDNPFVAAADWRALYGGTAKGGP